MKKQQEKGRKEIRMKKLIIICAALLLASPAFGTYYTGNSDYTNPYTTDAYTRGLWHFNETSGDTIFVDSSSNGNDGEIGRNPWGGGGPYPANRYVDLSETLTWQAGYFGNAMTTGGSPYNGGYGLVVQEDTWVQQWGDTTWDTYVGVAGRDQLGMGTGVDMTIEFWMNPDATGGSGWNDRIMGKYTGGEYSVNFYDNEIQIGFYGSAGWMGVQSGDTVPLNEWTHVAICVDRTTLSDTDLWAFFFNGQLDSKGWHESGSTGHGGGTDGKPLFIGCPYNADSYVQYQGQLDELRISDVVRYIPEPTTLSLLAIAALAFFRRKK
jgi:hypothetical protein